MLPGTATGDKEDKFTAGIKSKTIRKGGFFIWCFQFYSFTLYLKVLFMSQKIEDDLQHIRKMMEQSSRFLSLSGLSGVIAGLIALSGAFGAWYTLKQYGIDYFTDTRIVAGSGLVKQLFCLAAVVLAGAIGFGALLTIRKTRKKGLKVWTPTTKKLLLALFVPLIFGGLFCLGALYHGHFEIIAPLTLLCYGMALINASRYTVSDVGSLGYSEALLGVIAMFLPGYGLVFWALGFGVLHIIYGLLMHKKYQ